MNWTTGQQTGEIGSGLHDEDEKRDEVGGHEQCALFMGSTGWLDESSCEWAGYPCVCELSAELLPAYSRFMLSSRQTRNRDAERLRTYVVTLFSMALGLPLLLDRRVLHIGQWLVGRGTGSAAAPSRETVHRTLAVHAAWALVIIGWTPFIWQTMAGNWHAAGLGNWPNYTPFGPVGMWIICETAPLRHFPKAGLGAGMVMLGISTAILYRALAKVYHDHTILMHPFAGVIPEPEANDRWLHAHNLENPVVADETPIVFGGISLVCFWIGSAVLNGYGGVDLLVQQCTKSNTPPECFHKCVHAKLTSYGRTIPGVCGVLLLLVCMDYKMRLALREMAAGTTATALTWIVTGIAFNPRNRASWMGSASNGLSATILPAARGRAT